MNRLLLIAAVAVALVAGCAGGGSTPGATVTPPESAPVGAPAAATATAAPVPSLSDVSQVAATIADAFLQRDIETLIGFTATTSMPCVAEVTENQRGPICPRGTFPGASVQAFSFAVCQGGWTTDISEAFSSMTEQAGRLVVLAELGSPSVDWPAGVPYGELLMVFEPRTSSQPIISAAALYVAQGRIVRAQNGCRTVEQFVTRESPRPTVIWSTLPGSPLQPSPPPYNRFIRPDTGRFEVYEWDDRPLTAAQKAAQPWYDSRWKPFSDCMIAEGYEVRADSAKAFAQQDLDQVVTRANAQLPDADANKRIGGNTSGVPGIAGAFLRCAGRWLALAPEAYGLGRLEPGQVPLP